jgi:hypothetical protein
MGERGFRSNDERKMTERKGSEIRGDGHDYSKNSTVHLAVREEERSALDSRLRFESTTLKVPKGTVLPKQSLMSATDTFSIFIFSFVTPCSEGGNGDVRGPEWEMNLLSSIAAWTKDPICCAPAVSIIPAASLLRTHDLRVACSRFQASLGCSWFTGKTLGQTKRIT